jgi:hypothetical protein
MPAAAARRDDRPRDLRAQALTSAYKLTVIRDFLATEKTSPPLLLSTLSDAAALLRQMGDQR